ncbi:MAG TPA: hypothetical protein DCQ64_18820, partial [Candidatus Rokubacteria bacterium]|nr:hypothetical protein [Candidatus Rokubacteria bacterium]
MSGPAIPQLNQRESTLSVIRALLRQQGSRVLSGSAEGFIERVLALPLPGRVRSVIAPLLAFDQVDYAPHSRLAATTAAPQAPAGAGPRT